MSGPGSGGGALVAVQPLSIKLRILSDGLAGHEAQTLGVAEALGLVPEIRRVNPRLPFAALAPFGPIDPRESPRFPGSPVGPPWPDMAFASGRRTLPYLRRLKRESGRRVFTVYFNAPANGRTAADLIIAPMHDGLFGRNVATPLTPPNRISAERLASARRTPDPRVASLQKPRAALLIGGDNRHFRFRPPDAMALADIVRALFAQGYSVMATASRRTPRFVAEAAEAALREGGGWLWDGEGENPYLSMLASADVVVVTADSVNMVGEAAATGAPVYIFAPIGGHRKIADYLARLERLGAVRPWRGVVESWRHEPVNSTDSIAASILKAYEIFRGLTPPLPPMRDDEDEEDVEDGEDDDCDAGHND
ncbi:mitochondrial fission ELM1 family protein [Methylocystis heyeri]|uniref:Nucleoside-diphosphate sugar epimerase n=1 Tax=Methylocystis heyeri TaxID=391905 RepID=A0A6B8KDE3_9HYPH|nr:mitochondrial fission ELM1 family protein [Methylocystis heyeri]QGM46454.1 hypothetical protein H2LOC_012540 [Methylocystis heyeri]